MSVFKKNIWQFLKYTLFFILAIISFSPATLVKLTTGHLDSELAQLYFEHRMQAAALFVGVGLVTAGLKTVKRRKIILKSRLFRNRKDFRNTNDFPNKNDLEITGKEAFNYGITLMAIGIVATVWSLFFWIQYVIPEIF